MLNRLWIGWTFFKNPLASWGRGIPGVPLSREEEALLMAFGKGLGRLRAPNPSSSPASLSPPGGLNLAPGGALPSPAGAGNPAMVAGTVYGPDNPLPAPPGGYPPLPVGWGGTPESHYRYLIATGQCDP